MSRKICTGPLAAPGSRQLAKAFVGGSVQPIIGHGRMPEENLSLRILHFITLADRTTILTAPTELILHPSHHRVANHWVQGVSEATKLEMIGHLGEAERFQLLKRSEWQRLPLQCHLKTRTIGFRRQRLRAIHSLDVGVIANRHGLAVPVGQLPLLLKVSDQITATIKRIEVKPSFATVAVEIPIIARCSGQEPITVSQDFGQITNASSLNVGIKSDLNGNDLG